MPAKTKTEVSEYVNELMDEHHQETEGVTTMFDNIFNHAIELTTLVIENDDSMTSQKQIYKAYRESFEEVLKMVQRMG